MWLEDVPSELPEASVSSLQGFQRFRVASRRKGGRITVPIFFYPTHMQMKKRLGLLQFGNVKPSLLIHIQTADFTEVFLIPSPCSCRAAWVAMFDFPGF